MRKYWQKSIIFLSVVFLILQPYLYTIEKAVASESEEENYASGAEESPEAQEISNQTNDDPGPDASEPYQYPEIDSLAILGVNLMSYVFDNSNTLTSDDPENPMSKITDLTESQRLVFNPSDLQDLRIMYCLGDVIPDYENNPDSLAAASGKTVEAVLALKNSNPEQYATLIKNAKESARDKIVGNLKNDLPNLACVLGTTTTAAAEMLKNDPEAIDAVISYAKDDIVIDRRILTLLVNLVTPKDQGGAGHERIKVYRIRRNYDREKKMYSRESDAIYQQLAEQREQSQINSISDLVGASSEDIENESTFDQAIATGAVLDQNNRNQGDLLFNDNEDERNLSAHFKGEAVDISEVDNIRCTLIKKKRIGSDKKIPQPPTPIELTWQTTAGYNADQQTIAGSLNSQFRRMANGEFLDLLDEFNISLDDNVDLSNASLSDIVDLIGQSLISEIINSPTNSLSGYSFSDTIKKIGAYILADKLGLPRSGFVGADFGNLDNLEANIGQAVVEQRLGLPYGSLSGNSLSEVLANIGVRKLENELTLPTGTLSPSHHSQTEIRLAAGRRTIENELYLEFNTFTGETTFSELRKKAGERKIDLIFANPSEVDQRLDLDLGQAQRYKSAGISPDEFANLVGAKKLADSAYLLRYTATNQFSLDLSSLASDLDRSQNKTLYDQLLAGNNNDSGYVTNYQQLGIDTLAKTLDINSDLRRAFSDWLINRIKNPDCAIPQAITLATKDENGNDISVTIPEDAFMTKTGLSRGDFFRLFGCENIYPKAVFKRAGEQALYDAVRKSSAAENLRAKFLADHPEIAQLTSDIEFYKTRVDNIKKLTDKINSDWKDVDSAAPAVVEIKNITNRLQIRFAAADLTSVATIRNLIRELTVSIDQLCGLLSRPDDSTASLRDKMNGTLSDVTTIIHNVDEIFAGEEQPEITALQISDLDPGSSKRTSSGNDSDSPALNLGTLALMLAGKISPTDYFISIGSVQIENTLDLPNNAILYFAKYTASAERNKNFDKNVFFRVIGQARIEEEFSMPAYFFQGAGPGDDATLLQIRDHIADAYNISSAEAGARLMRALGLSGTIESPTSGLDFRAATAKIDQRLNLPDGTTAQYLLGNKIAIIDSVGNKDQRIVSGTLNIADKSLEKFLSIKKGYLTIDGAKEANGGNEISYTSHNEFAKKSQPTAPGTCPVTFTFKEGFSIADVFADESYNYIDADNTVHSFPSYNEAKNYADLNNDKKIDFLTNIAKGLAKAGAGNENEIKNRLTDFLNNKDAGSALTAKEIEDVSASTGIPQEILAGIFSRDLGQNSTSDYKLIVGRKTAEKRIMSNILGGIGFTVAGLEIDADDIYDILAGNGKSVLYRIGSQYLEQELNIPTNEIINLIESTDINLANCNLREIGANVLGGLIGLKGISLDGNLYDNIGGAKIEETLGLPAQSFRGATLDELIKNIGETKFAEVFRLPMADKLDASTLARFFGTASTALLAQDTSSEQLAKINQIIENPDATTVSGNNLNQATNDLKNEIKNRSNEYKDAGRWQYNTDPKNKSDVEQNKYIARAAEIDSLLGLDRGTTQTLLTGGISPDNYRRKVSELTLRSMAEIKLGEVFGLDIPDPNFAYNLVQDIKMGNYPAAFDKFQQVFGYDFDGKLDMPAGTIQRLLADPSQAESVAFQIAASKFDQSLGLDPGSELSFSYLYANFYQTGNKDYLINCLPGNETCFARDSEPHHLGKYADFNAYVSAIAGQIFWNYASYLVAFTGYSDGRADPRVREMAINDISTLIRGDTSFLTLAAAIATAQGLHVYDRDGTSETIPTYFQITYEDIRYAIRGDYGFANSYSDRAAAAMLSKYQNADIYGPKAPESEDETMSATKGAVKYAAQCPPNSTDPNCVDPSIPGLVFYSSTDEQKAEMRNDFYSNNSADPKYDDPSELTTGINALDAPGLENINQVKESAAKKSRDDLRKNLMYRMADARLYKQDSSIPVGFTKTMLAGNGFQRTYMLFNYLKNGLKNGKIFGVDIGFGVDIEVGWEIYDFINDPNSFSLDNFNNLVTSGKLTKFDDWLSGKATDFFGFDLQPGTFSAIFAGIKNNNNFLDNYNVVDTSGKIVASVDSLKTIYVDTWGYNKITSWADKTLNLPAGTAKELYTMYNDLSSARASLAAAQAAGDADKISQAQQKVTSVKAELISFVITTLFAKQIAQVESALGLVPGTGAMLVGMGVSYLMGAAIPGAGIVLFIAMNLFGVYKVKLVCTADGYYPGLESPPDPTKYDVPNLGQFDGMNANSRRSAFIAAAQYKARTLAGDALMLSERTGDETAIPSQIMVGRQEDADYWAYKIDDVICSKIGGCEGTRAGMWYNPQSTTYTHIGF